MSEQNFKISFCIPTYNRADLLEECIKSIVSQSEFVKNAQIVISDNASTDNTAAISLKYINLYPDNIIYNRNSENIGMEQNFKISLDLAQGKLLKLINDYTILLPNSIKVIVKYINYFQNEDTILFFINSKQKNKDQVFESIENFLIEVNFWLTWIGAFSIWKNDYIKIDEKQNKIGLLFFHILILLKSLKEKKRIIVIYEILSSRLPITSGGGYNFFDVFLDNFLGKIINDLFIEKDLTFSGLRKIKRYYLRKFIIPQTASILRNEQNKMKFNRIGLWKLLKYFWNYPQFYFYAIYLFICPLIKKK